MKMKRFFSLFLALTMLLAMTACGNGNASEPKATTGNAVANTEANAQTEAAGSSKYGGVLRVAQATFDMSAFLGLPCMGAGSEITLAQRAACEPLWYINPDNEIVWVLGTGYEVSEDRLTYTFGIREGIKFHDGSDLNAEVVAWNWSKAFLEAGLVAGIVAVDVVDDMHVSFTLNEPNPFIIEANAGYVGLLISSKLAYDTYGEEYCMTHPVGTGPFVFDSMEVGSYAKFKRNENYWQKDEEGNQLPYLDGVEFYCISDPTVAAAALANGELDMYYSQLDGLKENLETYDMENLVIGHGSVPSGARGIRFGANARKAELLRDRRLRQAIAYAIDGEAIAASFEDDAIVYSGHLPAKGAKDCPEDIVEYDYNPEKAKELLADAGYPDGFEIEINIDTSPFANKVATLVQYYLGEVGIDVKIMAYENTERNAIQTDPDCWSQLFVGTSGLNSGYTFASWSSRSPYRDMWCNMMPFEVEPDLVAAYKAVGDAPDSDTAWKMLAEYNRVVSELCSEYMFLHVYNDVHYYVDNLYPATAEETVGPFIVLQNAYFTK